MPSRYRDTLLGLVLRLARDVAKNFRQRFAADELGCAVADSLDSMIATDDLAADGLTRMARSSLHLALHGLSKAISSDLDVSLLTRERLKLWLSGDLGTRVVGSILIELLMRGMEEASRK